MSKRRAFSCARARLYIVAPLAAACLLSPSLTLFAAPKDPAAALSGKDPQRKAEALEQARRGRVKFSGSQLRKTLAAEKDGVLKVRALQALSVAEGGDAVPELAARLAGDPDAVVRQAAAQELGRFARKAAAVKALAQALRQDTDLGVRCACALSLGLSDKPEAAAALAEASRDQAVDLRRQAAFSLTRQKGTVAAEALKVLTQDPDAGVREAAR